MTVELFCLSLFALVIVANILIHQLTSMFDYGLKPILGSREDVKFVGITGRLERAILNSIIAIALFAPSVIILSIVGVSTTQTVIAAQVFVAARIVYSVSYALNIVLLRSAGWTIGLICILGLYYNVINIPIV